ncbi:MAG: hypothetical protein V3V67_08740 [Myxococcota bacterium]
MNGSVKNVSDRELHRRLNELVGRERHGEADVLLHLGEVEARRLYLAEGCSSMYGYCSNVLHFSEGVAGQRIRAARVARRFPILLERLRRGEIHLAGLSVLATHLSGDNHLELLERARHKTRNAIEEIVADLAPKPDAPSLVRELPEAEAVAVSAPAAAGSSAAALPSAPAPARYERRVPEPLGQQRYKVQFTAGRELYDKLREAQSLLRQQIPDGDLAEIFDRALTLLVEDVKRKKFAQTSRPAKRQQTPDAGPSRHIPAEIKRAVYARDGGSCAFVGRNGRRCGVRDRLEYHHLDPWARSVPFSQGDRAALSAAQLLRGGARLRSGLHGALPQGTAHVADGSRSREREWEFTSWPAAGAPRRSRGQQLRVSVTPSADPREQRSGPGAAG